MSHETSLPLHAKPGRSITARSLAIGTLMVGLVCGVTPYNDNVVNNTMMVGFYLPVIVVLLMVGLVVLINAPLHRFAPKYALSTGELGVILAMTLVSCGIPGQGMMRTLLPTMISPFNRGSDDPRFWANFLNLHLPSWLFPIDQQSPRATSSPIVQWFYSRVPPGESAPYGAWVVPLLGWGVFMGAMVATMLALASIITPQWATNERLAFPIAQVQQALIEPPQPGRVLNELFRNPIFWVAVVGVVITHSIIALHDYFPKAVPALKLSYDLQGIITEEPWVGLSRFVKTAQIYFSFLGLAYFISSRVSFSLWSIYLVTELISMNMRSLGSDMPIAGPAWMDQHLGSCVAFLCGVIWIGRHHWARVIREAIRPSKQTNAPRYRAAVLSAICGLAVMVAWMLAVGVQWWMAFAIVGMVMMVHVVVARVVAETGLAFIRVMASPLQIVTNLPTSMLRGNDVYFASVFNLNGSYYTRESLFGYITHAVRVNDSIHHERVGSRKGLIFAMVWAVVFGFVVASASSLYCYYNYSMPLGNTNDAVLNSIALQSWPRDVVADPLNRWADGKFAPKPHSPGLQMSIGMVVTVILQTATLRWSWWPFLPVGYLVSMTWYIQNGWLSIFLGWLCKLLIVKYGGATAFQKAKPIFIGLVVGEALAAGLWALINLGLAMAGETYQATKLLPF